jgi:hypothetical protein
LDTANDLEERVYPTYGFDSFQALFLAMRTAVRLLIGHLEYFHDEEFYLDPSAFEQGQGQTGIDMATWLAESYAWSIRSE